MIAGCTGSTSMSVCTVRDADSVDVASLCWCVRCSEKVSFLTDFSFEEWCDAWRKVR